MYADARLSVQEGLFSDRLESCCWRSCNGGMVAAPPIWFQRHPRVSFIPGVDPGRHASPRILRPLDNLANASSPITLQSQTFPGFQPHGPYATSNNADAGCAMPAVLGPCISVSLDGTDVDYS